MRLLRMIAASCVVLTCHGWSFVNFANAADDAAKVYYKDGTRIETPELEMKINLQVQPRFTFADLDAGGRRAADLDTAQDRASFDLRRVQVFFSGNLLNKQFSYKVQTDLRPNSGGSTLKDAWLQWNSESANVRWGQFKVPFSRQENVGDEQTQFIDRSRVSDFFAPSRHMGAMLHGPIAEGVNYYFEGFNGESTGEGINKPGADNKLAGVAAITASTADYGSRGYEGDQREVKSGAGFTGGVSTIYGQGNGDLFKTGNTNNFDRFDLNVDAGVRSNGFAVQSEIYYSYISLDKVDGDAGEADLFGLYAQGSYLMNRNWELALRFGLIEPDADVSAIDDQEEYNLVVNYYINGHFLKLQTGVTWDVTNFDDSAGGNDVTDFRVESQLAGYF